MIASHQLLSILLSCSEISNQLVSRSRLSRTILPPAVAMFYSTFTSISKSALILTYSKPTLRLHLCYQILTTRPGKDTNESKFEKELPALVGSILLVSRYKYLGDGGKKYHEQGTSNSSTNGTENADSHKKLVHFVSIFKDGKKRMNVFTRWCIY